MKRLLAGYLALCALVLTGCTAAPDQGGGAPSSAPGSAETWRPSPDAVWEIQLDAPVALRDGVEVYDIDVDNDAELVAQMHDAGAKVVCYFDAGGFEEWRSDAGSFPAEVLGEEMAGWPDERWLDIRRLDVLEPIMRVRIESCAAKGFDAIDPDNINVFENPSGFPLSAEDAVDYFQMLAGIAREHGMAIGLKNSPPIVDAVVDLADFAVTEQCQELGECESYQPFVQAGKAVLDIEYAGTAAEACSGSPQGFTTVFADVALDGPVTRCP